MRCTYGIFSREIAIHTVVHGVYIRFGPTLLTRLLQQMHYSFVNTPPAPRSLFPHHATAGYARLLLAFPPQLSAPPFPHSGVGPLLHAVIRPPVIDGVIDGVGPLLHAVIRPPVIDTLSYVSG